MTKRGDKMQAKREFLYNKDDENIEYVCYPKTLTECVTDAEGNNLDDTIKGIFDGSQQVGDAEKLGGVAASEYFTKDGGVVNGDIIVSKESGTATVRAKNTTSNAEISLEVTNDGKVGLYDYKNRRWLIVLDLDGVLKGSDNNNYNVTLLHTGNMADHVLPLSGGTLTGQLHLHVHNNGYSSLLKNSSATADYGTQIVDENKAGEKAYIEFGANTPLRYVDKNRIMHAILHEGNKPTGTYTGNGDASNFRLVATGGIGDGCIVRSSNGVAIVTGSCVSILSGNSAVTDNSSTWQNGELGMFSNHAVLNASGVTYTYHVI